MICNEDLIHGAIYRLSIGVDARCNICYQGSEVWFTGRNGQYYNGIPEHLIAKNDSGFRSDDVAGG